MSSTSIRYHSITLSFLPYRRDQRLSRNLRHLRIRTSRRRAKRALRDFLAAHMRTTPSAN